jgi:lysine biosynthesis protein LysW
MKPGADLKTGDRKMKKTKCPACRQTIKLERGFRLEDLVKCPECKSILEVVRFDPLSLEIAEDPMTSPYIRRNRIY